jgi:hypothetical protein
VGAALGAGKRVDLIDDDPLHPGERVARLRGEQQVERLGGGHEDVRRTAAEHAPLLGRRVAGAHGDAHLAWIFAAVLGGQAYTGQRRTQVALDVMDERLERGDV